MVVKVCSVSRSEHKGWEARATVTCDIQPHIAMTTVAWGGRRDYRLENFFPSSSHLNSAAMSLVAKY